MKTIKQNINNCDCVSFIFFSKRAIFLFAASFIFIGAFAAYSGPAGAQEKGPANNYSWLKIYNEANSIKSRIPAPEGFKRNGGGGFAEWLRALPLKDGKPPVYLYDKKLKRNQGAHFAVIDIDCGERDLQQCADAVMRLRAEYFFAKGDIKSIKFSTGDNKEVSFTGWLKNRIAVNGRTAGEKEILKAATYQNFQKYMIYIFSYAGTYSLSRSLKKVENVRDIEAGDVFIKGGFPGHAVLVADTAVSEKNGEKVFLLLQSYMPAQNMHILNNPNEEKSSPWYNINFGKILKTPEWDFTNDQLMRF